MEWVPLDEDHGYDSEGNRVEIAEGEPIIGLFPDGRVAELEMHRGRDGWALFFRVGEFGGPTHFMKKPPPPDPLTDTCSECSRAAVWWRRTQFAGDHPYCKVHARLEKDFGALIDGQFFWTQTDPNKKGSP